MAVEIGVRTPFDLTRELAALLRARFGDKTAISVACRAMRSSAQEIRDEAALALSSWRVVTTYGQVNEHRLVVEQLRQLCRSPFPLEAAVGLALLGATDAETARDGLRAADAETVFAAALAVGDVPRLREALQGESPQCTAAAVRLIALGVLEPIEPLLREGSPELLFALTDALARREGGAGILADALLHVVESTPDQHIRERAARVLCRAMKPEIALRVARVGKEDQHIIQSMLSEGAALPSSTVAEVCRYLAAEGHLRFGQYGVEEAAKRGAIPDRFVPSCFHEASDETRGELLRIAEIQLEAREHEELHRFVLRCVFGPYPGTIRAGAWWSLSRWYHQQDRRSSGPFSVSTVPIERFFGSVEAFTPRLIAVLGDHASLVEVGLYEFLAHLLGTAEPTAVQTMMNDGDQSRSLLTVLEAIARGTYWTYLRTAVIAFLECMATHPDFRKTIEDRLRVLSTTSEGDVRMASLRLLEKLASPAS
ncbi:MAG: hypothetical protein H0W83_18290 [Planctomycetes bacterium]|nr:hypothetical protein [Planctomycetota bacterium]